MRYILRCGSVWLTGVLWAACAGAQTYDGSYVDTSSMDTSRCEVVSGQTEIEGTLQPFVGRACLQSNGVWVFVSENGSWVAPADGYTYYPSPWYWGSPYFSGSTVLFIDRFHHRFHRFDHDHRFDRHFHEWSHMPTAGHSSGMRSWGGGHGWAGGGMRRN